MNKSQSLIAKGNISALQIFQLLRFSAAILISVVLVKSGMELKIVAVYEILFFLANFFSLFWVQGLKNAFLSYFPSISTEQRSHLIFNLWILFSFLALIFGGILFIFQDEIIINFTKFEEVPFIDLMVIYMLFNAPTILNEFTLMLYDKSRSLVSYGIIIFSMQFVLIGSTIWVTQDLHSILLAVLIWVGLKWIYSLYILYRYSKIKFDPILIKRFFLFGLPLILHLLIGNGMEYVDGFLVSYYFEEEMFAIFRYGAKELPLTLILVGALVNAAVPMMVSNFEDGLEVIRERSTKLMKWLFPLSIIFVLISPIVFPFVYDDSFRQSAFIFNVYILIILPRIILPQALIYAKHDNKILMHSAILELIANLTLSLWFLSIWGVMGIVFATLIAGLVNKFYLMIYCYRKYEIKVSSYLDLKWFIGMSTILILAFCLSWVIFE